jgi:DNA-binding NtrC family response regulator
MAVSMRKKTQTMEKSLTLRVLVVDDEPLIRWSLAETLGDCGHEVSEAADGREAVEAVAGAERPIDVVLLDYRLPDSNNFQLLSTIRRLAPSAAIVMMTAHGTSSIEGALELGAYTVVSKPFEVHEMARLVIEAYQAASRRG